MNKMCKTNVIWEHEKITAFFVASKKLTEGGVFTWMKEACYSDNLNNDYVLKHDELYFSVIEIQAKKPDDWAVRVVISHKHEVYDEEELYFMFNCDSPHRDIIQDLVSAIQVSADTRAKQSAAGLESFALCLVNDEFVQLLEAGE